MTKKIIMKRKKRSNQSKNQNRIPFNLYKQKVISLKEAGKISEKLKKQGRRIVTLNGSFDLLHIGHIYTIQEAKKQGDILFLGLNSDKSYKKYKDKRGPLFNQVQRAILLSAIKDIDYIVIFDETTPIKVIETIKPDVHCNGAEYGRDCIEAETVIKNKGVLHLIPELKDKKIKFSTSELINKILERFQKEKKKAVFLDRDGILNKDYGYKTNIKKFQFVDGIVELLKYLKSLGYIFIIITNQGGISKGEYTIQEMKKFNSILIKKFKENGILFQEIYYCPHHPDNEICDCRKPGFVLFQRAKKEHSISMELSWTIGDKITDCIAGKKAGTKTILLKSKYSENKDILPEYVDYYVRSLKDIKKIIKS